MAVTIGAFVLELIQPKSVRSVNTACHKIIMKNESDNIDRKAAAAALGRRGGKAVAKKHGRGYMKELGKRGADARWKTKD